MKIPVDIDDDVLKAVVSQGSVQALQNAVYEAIRKDPAFNFIIEEAVRGGLEEAKNPHSKLNAQVIERSMERVVMFAVQDIAAAKSGILRRYTAAVAGRTVRLIVEQLDAMEDDY